MIISEKSQFLSETQRPQDLKQIIDISFNIVAKNPESSWHIFNGAPSYGILTIDEISLIRKIIEQSPNRKNFYFLDIGAGNFQLPNRVYETFKKDPILEGKRLHVFGIRGEKGETIEKTEGHCELCLFNAFRVECIYEEFNSRNLDLKNKFDFIVSRECFRHLADPVGTFLQTCRLMRPKTGLFAGHGFYFSTAKDNSLTHPLQVYELLYLTRQSFLIEQQIEGSEDRLPFFLLQKSDDKECEIPWTYTKTHVGSEIIDDWHIGSGAITAFSYTAPLTKKDEKNAINLFETLWNAPWNTWVGDQALYQWLYDNKLIASNVSFKPAEELKN